MNKCQVCGKGTIGNSLNCGEHAHIREKMALLAQDIYNLESSIEPDKIKQLAIKHGCLEITVRNHLRRQGFRLVKKWTSKGK